MTGAEHRTVRTILTRQRSNLSTNPPSTVSLRRIPMNASTPFMTFAVAIVCAASASAQTTTTRVLPSTVPEAREWSVAVAHRASELLSSPAMWDRSDTTNTCPASAKTLSIYCALERAADEALHSAFQRSSGRVECSLRRDGSHEEGSCGAIFGQAPVFILERVPRITSGVWRSDARPTQVWAGVMLDAAHPAMQAARQAVSAVSTKKYASRLIGFNNDSSITFADLQRLFRVMDDRLSHAQPSVLIGGGDSVEVEVYTDNTGVIRTVEGWFPISRFDARDSTLRFAIDTTAGLVASALDRRIIERADAILASDAVWNRADNRECPAAATTWSIYCALERATIEVTGGFHHRRPALELVRQIIEDRTKDRNYNHRLMDYNNDPSTHLGDVRSLFAEARKKM